MTLRFWTVVALVIMLAFSAGFCVGAVWATRNAWTEDGVNDRDAI